MMKIKKTSWHYRFIRSTGEFPPHGLCEYIQKLVLNLAMAGFGIAILIALCWFVGSLPYIFTFGKVLTSNNIFDSVIFIITGALICSAIGWCIVKIASREVKYKKESIFVKYIKSKKQKVCPRIEFED